MDPAGATADSVDRVGLTLLHKQLVNICDEMAVSMMRTAYSPIFSEGLDFSTLILDRHGSLIATAGLNPAMLGASLYAATWVINAHSSGLASRIRRAWRLRLATMASTSRLRARTSGPWRAAAT